MPGINWEPIGPNPQSDDRDVSGRVGNALAVLLNFGGAGNQMLLVGAQTGGVFRSGNLAVPGLPAGLRWRALTDFNGLQGRPGS
jgi:hypothetical protein